MLNILSDLKDKVAHYLEVNLRLLQLNLIKRTSKVMGFFLFFIIILFVLFSILLFLGLGLAEVFTNIANGSRVAGFFMAMGSYFILILILFALRKSIVNGFANIFLPIFTEEDEDDAEDEETEERKHK